MTPDQPLLDVTDMVAVHNVFRDSFGAASTLVGDVAAGDTERIDLVANFYHEHPLVPPWPPRG